jgi:hypothetical protein
VGKPMENFNQFQSIYRKITGESVDWEDIPENLQKVFLNSKPLSGQEFIELPKSFGAAYFVMCQPSNSVMLEKIKEKLKFFESKYGITSEEFYRKYHNSEAIFDGDGEQVIDFLTWEGNYEEYLELKNASR